MSATATVIGGIGALILAWAIGLTLRVVTVRLWRAGCCARGHHRETVDTPVTADRRCIGENMYAILPRYRTVYRCVDCGAERIISSDTVFTPSRRVRAA